MCGFGADEDAKEHFKRKNTVAAQDVDPYSGNRVLNDRGSLPDRNIDPDNLITGQIKKHCRSQLDNYNTTSGDNPPNTEDLEGDKRIEMVLGWWEMYDSGFPTFARMSWSFIGMLLTSADVEWLFSGAGLQMDNVRGNLLPEQYEARLSLSTFVRHGDIILGKSWANFSAEERGKMQM